MILVTYYHIYSHTITLKLELDMTNTIDMIESIVNEWSKNIPSGIVDLKNETHLYELLKVLNEKIDDQRVVNAVMENIREQMREDY